MSRMRHKDGPSRRELDQITEQVRTELEELFQRHAIPQAGAERLLREALVRLSYQWGRIRNRSWWLVDSIETAARALSNLSPDQLLNRALVIYRQAKERHLEGKMLIKKGMALGHDGRFQQAIRCLRRGLSRIDAAEEPRLLVAAQHNLVGFLNESGEPDEALAMLRKTRRLYQDLGEPSHRARLSWLEGRITRDLGRWEEAEAALEEARGFFVQNGIGLDAALVLLDLATVYDRRGETAELKRLGAEMVAIFSSRDVHPEALAALALFQKAAAAEQVDRALLERIAAELQRTVTFLG